jgi:hypothetical protein
MHELLMTAGGSLLDPAQNSLLRYLTHSAVSLAIVGAVARLGDRMLHKVGPQAQHRLWVAALLLGAALPMVPTGLLTSYFSHGDASGVGRTATVTYQAIAAAAGRWTIPPLLLAALAAAYLLTVLLSVTRLLWRWRRALAMARRAAVMPARGFGWPFIERCSAAF